MFDSLLSNLNAENFQLMIRENFHWAAFIAFLGGLIDCLTPCSAMANTISVGYTSTIAPGVTRKRMWLLAFLFFMGVSLTYMGLGALFVAFGSVVQTFIGEYVEVVLFVMGFIFLYLFLLNKWYFDELYDRIFIMPAKRLGVGLWKSGDGELIDGVGPDGVAAAVINLARRASRLQTGFVYHYAFAMLIGVAVLVTWYYTTGGGH